MAALFITVTTAFDLNWVVAMIFIVIIGGFGSIEGPIIGTVVFFGIRELFTNALALTGSWYLIALGTVAVLTMLVAPTGIWPFVRDRLGIEWLSVKRDVPYAYAKSVS
jgi:branched-chain amino acid transport system permease protein